MAGWISINHSELASISSDISNLCCKMDWNNSACNNGSLNIPCLKCRDINQRNCETK